MTPPVNHRPDDQPRKLRPLGILLQFVIIIAILGGGVIIAMHLMKTGPKAKPRKFVPSPTFVKVEPVHYQPYLLAVQSMGTVVPAREIDLTAGVGGEIIKTSQNFVPGGFFSKRTTLLELDPVDFNLNIRQLESDVQIARNELTAEMGNQRIAAKEFDLLGQKVSDEEMQLMLRKPQLATKEANLETAESRLAQARRDLDRTRVSAPFNLVVRSQLAHMGARVTATTPLATVAGTDEFWLSLLVPVSQLQWLVFPDDPSGKPASEVRVYLHNDETGDNVRTGRLFRLAPDLEEQGRMAVVYATVNDPLCLLPENRDKPKLLLGSYIRADIEGTKLESVVPIARSYLRDRNTVWLMNEESKLEIRDVQIVAKTHDTVLITHGIEEGEKLITSNLSSPVEGTLVKLMERGSQNKEMTGGAVANAESRKKQDKEANQ